MITCARWFAGLALVAVVGVVAAYWYGTRLPASPFDGVQAAAAMPLETGQYAARVADCVACHSTHDGQPFAGGLEMDTPLGSIYDTNITPDPEHGIGNYMRISRSWKMREEECVMDVIDFSEAPQEVSRRRLADLPDRVVEGDPQHQSELHFTSPDGNLFAGSWTSTPGKWHAFTDKDEYCHIVSGRCALISEDGKRWEFGPGASFMIPNGFRGYWEVIETTTKHFVVRQH